MTTLEEKSVDWLYDHFQAVSEAAHRYLAAFGFAVAFSFLMVIAPKEASRYQSWTWTLAPTSSLRA